MKVLEACVRWPGHCCPERHSKDAAALRASRDGLGCVNSRAVLRYGLPHISCARSVHTVHGGGSAQRTFRAPNRDRQQSGCPSRAWGSTEYTSRRHPDRAAFRLFRRDFVSAHSGIAPVR